MKHRIKIKKGIAGLVAGLIAAIALLVIALPVMMQYQQHITKSYQIKEYATMLEEQKELEEKGLASCYEPSEKVISINNTLGRPVRIVMAYATDGENEEVKYYQPAIEIAPGVNILHVINNLSIITLNPSEIKTIKLITSRGTIIQPPYCREVVKVITYEGAVDYIIKKLQGYPVNLYLDENQIPEGLISELLGIFKAHGNLYIDSNNTIYIVNGTLVPKDDWIDDLESLLRELFGEVHYAPSFVIQLGILYPEYSVIRQDVGDTVATIINFTEIPDVGTDTSGCQGYTCSYISYGYDWQTRKPYVIIKLALSYVNKYLDYDSSTLNYNPVKFILANSGYNYLVVGLQSSAFDPGENNINTFSYTGEIYVASGNNAPASIDQADLKINFTVRFNVQYHGLYTNSTVKSASAKIYKRTGNSWTLIKTLPIYYRWYFELEWFGYRKKMWDQVSFIIENNILNEVLKLEPGDYVWISASAKFITDGTEYQDIYGVSNYEWVKYAYAPLQKIVDTWYGQYFSG